MMLFKLAWVGMESWLLKVLTEKLVALPFECALQTAQFVMTLGAAGFLAFIQAFMLETGIMIIKRVAIDPIKFKTVRIGEMWKVYIILRSTPPLHTHRCATPS